MRQIKWIVLHCTAGNQNQTIESIKSWWRQLGWKKYGYHHLITPDGVDHHLTPIDQISNGVAGYNAHSIHISYTGGIKDGKPFDNRTNEQKATMKKLVQKYMKAFPEAKVLGHREFSPDKNKDGVIQPGEWIKSCPSFEVKDWLKFEGLVNNPVVPTVKKAVHTSSGSGVNLRRGAGVGYAILAKLTDGTACMVIEEVGDWSKVQVTDKLIGYVKNEYLK